MIQSPISAESISGTMGKTVYPEPYASLVGGRLKRKLGDYFGLQNFGVNLTHLSPGAISALFHRHSKQDEFIYILEGTPTLIVEGKEFILNPGDCYGFKSNDMAHQIINKTQKIVSYLEIGDRIEGDEVEYPNDNLKATLLANGVWQFTHKDERLGVAQPKNESRK